MKLSCSFGIFPSIYKNCEISFQLRTALCSWFEFNIRFLEKCDHAGLYFTFSLLKLFFFEINFYDSRHWNYDENRWCHYLEKDLNCGNYNKACTYQKLNLIFTKQSAENLLAEVNNLQSTTNDLFAKYHHPVVEEHKQEITISLQELEDWLKTVLKK